MQILFNPKPVHESRLEQASLAFRSFLSLISAKTFEVLVECSKKFSPEKTKQHKFCHEIHYSNYVARSFALKWLSDCLIASSTNSSKDLNPFIYILWVKNIILDNQKTNPHLKNTFYFSKYEDNEYNGKGICLGMCMEFVSEYFTALKSCLHEDALLKTSIQFFEGGSEKAIYSQYIQRCTGYKSEGMMSTVPIYAAASFFKNINIKIETDNHVNLYVEENIEFLTQQMATLKEGFYIVRFKATIRKENISHAIVYCNQKNRSFVFCPDFGSIVVSPNDPIANFFRLQDFYSKFAHHFNEFYHLTAIYFFPIQEAD